MVTIHNLQQHDNLEIYKKAFNIMDKYFPDDEEVESGINAAVDSTGTFAVSILLSYFSMACTHSHTVQPRRRCPASWWLQLRWSVVNGVLCQ